MHGNEHRFPVELITVDIVNDKPRRNLQNDDVAFIPVTRFNVRMDIPKTNRWSHLEGQNLAESPDYDTYWLRRLEIFERVCIPSVVNLTPRPDAWFIAFGDMESSYVQALLERLRAYPWIRPYLRGQGGSLDDGPLEMLLADRVQSLGKSFLCSTRFDSDDSLHQQFVGTLDTSIRRLREHGFVDEQRCLNFPFGLMQSAGELSVYLRRTNMFESVFEPLDRIEGPYQGGHDAIRERMPLVEVVTNQPMWIYHRHGDTLEPGWVTARERLSLTEPERYLPMFGLSSEPADALRPPATRESILPMPPRLQASRLRERRYWNGDDLSAAVELANLQNQSTLAQWLPGPHPAAGAAAGALREFENGTLQFLNAALLAWLGGQLREAGDIAGALRAYDYAIALDSGDRLARAARDDLSDSLHAELDLDQQIELAALIKPGKRRNLVVMMVSALGPGAGELVAPGVPERAEAFVQDGYAVRLVILPHPEQPGDAEPPAVPEGKVRYDVVARPKRSPAGIDRWRHDLIMVVARRVAQQRPCLLATDSTAIAQIAAAAVGRAFGIPVDFGPGPAVTLEG